MRSELSRSEQRATALDVQDRGYAAAKVAHRREAAATERLAELENARGMSTEEKKELEEELEEEKRAAHFAARFAEDQTVSSAPRPPVTREAGVRAKIQERPPVPAEKFLGRWQSEPDLDGVSRRRNVNPYILPKPALRPQVQWEPMLALTQLSNYRARFLLYRSQNLQENMRLKALAEIYTMHSFALL